MVGGSNGRWKRVRIGAPDPTLTRFSGIAAVTELVDRLGVVEAFDLHARPYKQRDQGLSPRRFPLGLGCAQLLGEASVFVAQIGDVTRFAGPHQLTCWAGLTPEPSCCSTDAPLIRAPPSG